MEEQKKAAITEDEVMKVNYENNMLKSKLKEAYAALEELSNQRGIKRLEFLFKIIENNGGRFTEEIIKKAVDEISEVMYPPVEDNKDNKDNE